MLKQKLLESVLNSGVWGTIGPKSISAAETIARRISGKYGILMHSADAALQTQLRALEITYGDEVIVASYGDPMNAMTVAGVGAVPIFADIDPHTATLSPLSVKKTLTNKIKAVIADIPGGNPCDAIELESICQENGVKLIINLGDGYNSALDGKPLTHYAWGTVINLADGCALSAGEGGALVHNDTAAYAACCAYHNCGRAHGEGDTLIMDAILGGNMRITEWQAAMAEAGINELDAVLAERKTKAETILESVKYELLAPLPVIDKGSSSYSSLIFRYNKDKNNGVSVNLAVEELRRRGYNACRPWKAMHRQPVFTSPYFQKVTGHSGGYNDNGLDNSIAAENEFIWIKL